MPTSFVNESVRFDATVGVFEESVAGVGSSTADLERYYAAHASEFDTACFTVAEYSSQSDAAAAIAQVAAGTPFAQVATAATGGGPQGCDILYGVAADLPAGTNLESLALNTVSSPIAENGDYLVVEITKRTPTPFATAQTEVESAVQNAGATKARTEVDAAEKAADVWVNRRYGQWTSAQAQVLPPTVPLATDVLNAAANGAVTGTSQSATSSTGQTP
jgi:topoisomerase IA-like protein